MPCTDIQSAADDEMGVHLPPMLGHMYCHFVVQKLQIMVTLFKRYVPCEGFMNSMVWPHTAGSVQGHH